MLLALGMLMAFISVLFWYVEVRHIIDGWNPVCKVSTSKIPGIKQIENLCFKVEWFSSNIGAVIRNGMPLVIDTLATIFLTSVFGFSGGVTGGIIGLFTGNLFSAFIYYETHVRRKKQHVV